MGCLGELAMVSRPEFGEINGSQPHHHSRFKPPMQVLDKDAFVNLLIDTTVGDWN